MSDFVLLHYNQFALGPLLSFTALQCDVRNLGMSGLIADIGNQDDAPPRPIADE
jgi:hypothetical protein